MAKPLNMNRRIKKMESVTAAKPRNPVALAMALRGGQGRHPDKKKQANRSACRGKYNE